MTTQQPLEAPSLEHTAAPSASALDASSNNTAVAATGGTGDTAIISDSATAAVPSPPPVPSSSSSPKQPPPFLKYGYLFKQSSGKWKRKRWHQRWFVLDSETGVLTYFRHASLPESVHFRHDAHGALQLRADAHEPGDNARVALVIQGDLPRNAPSPFCFTVSSGSGRRALRICADTHDEFRDWTHAIALVMAPRADASVEDVDAAAARQVQRARSASSASSASSVSSSGPPSNGLDDDDGSESESDGASDDNNNANRVRLRRRSSATLANSSRNRPATTTSGQCSATRSIFPPNMRNKLSRYETTAALLLLNPIVVLIRFGSLQAVYATAFFINAVLVWWLWLHNARSDVALVPPALCPLPLRYQQHKRRASSTRFDALPTTLLDGNDDAFAPRDAFETTTLTTRPESLHAAQLPATPAKFAGTVNGTQAIAGASVTQCAPAPAAIVIGCWTQIDATRFNVRQGPNYRRTKLKAASTSALLDLIAIDVFRSDGKVDNIASLVDLNPLRNDDGALDLFVVNCQVPSYQPSNPLWGEKQGDGAGFNFVTYFAIPASVRAQLNSTDASLAPPAVQLLKDFMLDSSSSGIRDRFKAIGVVVNPQEQHRLGRTERHLLESYNGQPILTRPQHRFYRGDGYFEVDVDAHEFNFVARKGLVGVSQHFRHMVVDFGFVLEGQDDHELPEQVLGSVRLCQIDVRDAPVLE